MDLHLIYGVFILLLAFNYSTQQPTNDNLSPTNYDNNDDLIGNNGGLISTIRNRKTSLAGNLLQRLEAPRDRVLNLIKPVVKSEFSRNITKVLNSIWDRVQAANISLIRNPAIRTSIVVPINSTFERLKQITAKEDDQNHSNFELVNLDKPNNDFLYSSNNQPSDSVNPRSYMMNAEPSTKNEVLVELPVDKSKDKRRRVRYMENNYPYILRENQISPDRIHNLFNNVRQSGMRQCLALALCESNCPQLFSSGIFGRFRNLISRVESLRVNHEDHSYYLDARRNGNIYECSWCRRQYSCPYPRDYLIGQFLSQDNFY